MDSDSQSDEYREPQPSSPDTPRKRRRASTASSRHRSHKQPRRHGIEGSYSDGYRVLFNEHVTQAASRYEVSAMARDYTTQIGSSLWTEEEKATFFAALERMGSSHVPRIAGAVGTKSEAETRDFLLTLQDATADRGDTKLTLRDIPAAMELGSECVQQLDVAADALAWYQERFEASLEQQRYGQHWLITPGIADEIDDAINGFSRPRSASALHESSPKGSMRGVAGSCIACKKQKVRCNRASPCNRCIRRNIECEYPEKLVDAEDVEPASPAVPRPCSASRPHESGLFQAMGTHLQSCIACKRGKRKCDRGTPCDRCVSRNIDCQYVPVDRSGVAGACDRCKRQKAKCDRNQPCANCSRNDEECVYSHHVHRSVSRLSAGPSPAPNTMTEGYKDNTSPLPMPDEVESQILQAIPEAALLNARTMLRLSRDLFMNRSPDFPSLWPHWSEYTSELASEPSIYRTAFNDLHRLVVSTTKRLVHTAIMQSESRLRSQRLRNKHEVQPFVKARDVRAAIDVLGMMRDGNDRWKGVARRCGLKVLTSTLRSSGKRRAVVPWSEVERIMSADVRRDSRPTTDMESSTEPEAFKRRAVRSGTPLPMHKLTLSDSEDGTELESSVHDDDEDPRMAPRDATGKYMSLPPDDKDEALQQLRTLQDFDREASRQEEQSLWDTLGLRPTKNDETMMSDEEALDTMSEKLSTRDKDWRQTIDYRAHWEAHNRPPHPAKFHANQKSLSPMPAINDIPLHSSRSSSGDFSDGSSTSGARRPRRRRPGAVELRARGTTAYAALQGEELGDSDQDDGSSSLSAADEDGDEDVMEQDIPTQSIEAQDDSSGDEREDG